MIEGVAIRGIDLIRAPSDGFVLDNEPTPVLSVSERELIWGWSLWELTVILCFLLDMGTVCAIWRRIKTA